MTAEQRLERDLPIILDEIVMGPYPDYIDDVLSTTARGRQRPGWTFPERWLPVELVNARVPATRLPMRQLGVLALIAILLAAALAVYVGTHQPKLPAPFGPAANGLIPFESGGDVYVGDLATGQTRLLVSGPDHDWGAGYNFDGTKIGFVRDVPLDDGVTGGDVYVMNADGSGLVRVTPQPIRQVGYVMWAPDGRLGIIEPVQQQACVGVTLCYANELYLLAADGSGRVERFPTTTGIQDLQWRPPDGRTMLFRALVDGKFGLYSMGVDGTDRRTIIEPRFGTEMDMDLAHFSYSGDGSRIFYNHADAGGCCQLWTADADGTDQHVLIPNRGDAWDGVPVASPDGTRVAFWHHPNEGPTRGVAVVRVDGSGAVVQTGPVLSEGAHWFWAPDSSKILMYPDDGSTRSAYVLDPDGGDWTKLPWQSGPDLDWQRVAPPS
jgi:Tol biopolymer transport system component